MSGVVDLIPSIFTLSGGLDSVANLAFFVDQLKKQFGLSSERIRETLGASLCLTFDYGQKAAKKEMESARFFAEYFGIQWESVALPWLGTLGGSGLTDSTREIPDLAESDLDSLSEAKKTAAQVWVPNRNGVMIEVAAAYADRMNIGQILVGFNVEEATTFPDNSQEYLFAVTQALAFSTKNRVKVACITTALNKTEIVGRLLDLSPNSSTEKAFPFHKLWPCYQADQSWCLKCESCRRFLRATTDRPVHYHLEKGTSAHAVLT